MPTNASAPSLRDSRIDWLRGFALACIFVNHMPGNRLSNWTPRNFGFSDAAEIFVLLAGVAGALAFYTRFEAQQALRMSGKSIRRAGELYLAHLAASMAAIGILFAANWFLNSTEFDDLVGATALFESPVPGLIGLVTGGYQIGYFNILPLYVALLLALPGYLWLARISKNLMLFASATLYAATYVYQLQMPSYPVEHGWYFNPFAWQLLYATGLYLGIMKIKGEGIGWNPVLGALAGAYIVYGIAWCHFNLGGNITFGLLPKSVDTLAKPMLPLSRYLHVLALAYLLVHSRVWLWMLRVPASDPLALMGKHSLPVFVTGSLLSLMGLITLAVTGPAVAVEVSITAAGMLIMIMVAYASEFGIDGAKALVNRSFTSAGYSMAIADHDDEITVRTR